MGIHGRGKTRTKEEVTDCLSCPASQMMVFIMNALTPHWGLPHPATPRHTLSCFYAMPSLKFDVTIHTGYTHLHVQQNSRNSSIDFPALPESTAQMDCCQTAYVTLDLLTMCPPGITGHSALGKQTTTGEIIEATRSTYSDSL